MATTLEPVPVEKRSEARPQPSIVVEPKDGDARALRVEQVSSLLKTGGRRTPFKIQAGAYFDPYRRSE